MINEENKEKKSLDTLKRSKSESFIKIESSEKDIRLIENIKNLTKRNLEQFVRSRN